jgi:hypothetical protein
MQDMRRAAGNRMPPKPRRRKPSGKLLPPEQRAKKAAAILARAVPNEGLGVDRAAIQGELYQLEVACVRTARVRSRYSKPAMRAMRTFLAALRRANKPIGGLPEDLRLLLGLDAQIHHLETYEKYFGREVEVVRDAVKEVAEDGKPVYRVRVRDVVPKPRRPAPNAFEKRLAAEAALRLCRGHEIEPTTTKGGTFCALAAALHGEPGADLQKHCRVALAGGKSASGSSESAPAPWRTPPIEWTTATHYTAGPPASLVTVDRSACLAYVCAVDHTSGASFDADLAVGRWIAVVAASNRA